MSRLVLRTRSVRCGLLACLAAAVTLGSVMWGPDSSSAAERKRAPRYGAFNPEHETIDLFEATASGQIDVKLYAKTNKTGRVVIENKTDQPLNIALPEVFAGQPVLAQFGGGGGGQQGGGLGGGGQGGGGGSQSVGGGFGGGSGGGPGGGGFGAGGQGGGGQGGGGGGQQGGGGFFNVAAEKVATLKVDCICLEHGKPDPRPAIAYELKPLDAYTDRSEVTELVKMFVAGNVPKRVAQAAAWHLANDMPWQELANKRIKRANGAEQVYFHPREVRLAIAAAQMAVFRGEAADAAAAEEAIAEEKADDYDSPGLRAAREAELSQN
jgi:hypothetical protein